MEFLEKIFSIKTEKETHYILQILGFKIKFTKPKYEKKKKKNLYYYYKKNNIDITTLPPATGQTRDIQLANLALLKELDYICNKNKLTYWLFAGSALGAVRHKGFIPWDDDLDVAMPREDYNKIINIFNEQKRNSNLYAELYNNDKHTAFIVKIRHKLCRHIFVDIFAVDFCNQIIETKEKQIQISNEIKVDRLKLKKNINNKIPIKECLKKYLNLRKKYISSQELDNSDILLGVEWGHSEKNWFIRYNSVFPITKTNFEGYKFNSMACPEDYLSDYYGNFMHYPKKLTSGHSMYLELTEQEKEVIECMKEELK